MTQGRQLVDMRVDSRTTQVDNTTLTRRMVDMRVDSRTTQVDNTTHIFFSSR